MSNILQEKLDAIKLDKDTNLLPENLKQGVTCLGIEGTLEEGIDTSDATAIANDIINPKTAYVQGQKITGTIEPIYGGTAAVLSEDTYNVTEVTLDDINYTYNIGIRCTTSTVNIYKLYESTPAELKDSTTLSYTGYAGTGRFAAQSVIIDNINYLRCFATDNTAASGTVGLISFLVKLSDYSIVTSSVQRYGVVTGNTAPAIEAVPFTDNRCIIQVNHASSSIGYSRTRMLTCTNSLTNSISNTTLKDWYGNTNNYGVETVEHSIQFSPDGRYMCSHYYGYGKYNSYVRHTLMLYSTDHFSTYTSKKDDGGTRSNNIYKIINNDYYTYNGTMYYLSSLSSVGKSFPVTPGSAAVMLTLGDYIFYARSVAETSMTVYSISGTTVTLYKTIPNIKANSIYFHYGDTIIYTTNNQACWYMLDKVLISLTRTGDTFYNTVDADVSTENVLTGKKFYNSTGQLAGTMPNNGALNYTPTTSQQSIPSGYTLGGTISAVDSSIDENIIPENIKKDVSILGVAGMLEASEDLSAELAAQDLVIQQLQQELENKIAPSKINPNIYVQLTEPAEKEGIWLKSNETLDNIVFEENIVLQTEWNLSKMANLKSTPFGFYYGSAVKNSDCVYLLGGVSMTDNYKYDPTTDTYTKMSDIPYNFYYGNAVSVGTDIYLLGSADSTAKIYNYKYDTLTDTYTKMSDIPMSAFYHSSSVAVGSDIYLLGGSGGKKTNYKYDTLTDTYTKMSNIPYNFYQGSAVVISSDIFLLGGGSSGDSKQACYKYNTTTDTYTKLSDIPYDFYQGSAVVFGNDIHLLGGTLAVNNNYKYNIQTDTYTKLTDIPYEFMGSVAILIDFEIYLFGGASDTSQTKVQVETVNTSEFQPNSVVVLQGTLAHKCKLVLGNLGLLTYYTNVYYSDSQGELKQDIEVYNGNGTNWTKISGGEE